MHAAAAKKIISRRALARGVAVAIAAPPLPIPFFDSHCMLATNLCPQLITCPEGISPGGLIQCAGPSAEMPTVAGVPVMADSGAAYPTGVAAGVAVGGPQLVAVGGPPHMSMLPEAGYVEVDEISPAGWLCLIVGCFACPGLNLLGLCMRERRLVPVSQVSTY